MRNLAHKTRRLLVNIAKVLPFAICAIVLIHYTETLFAILSNSFVEYCGCVVYKTPISWFIASYFEYGIFTIAISFILAIAMETCVYNRIAILYLLLNLGEKHYLSAVEIPAMGIIGIALANLSICSLFLFKGYYVTIK